MTEILEAQDLINAHNDMVGCLLLVAIVLTVGLLFAHFCGAKKS